MLPIGIGQLGTDTPEDWVTSVQRKKAGPTWTLRPRCTPSTPPAARPCPRSGRPARTTPWGCLRSTSARCTPSHGTNAQFGIGLRVSHGCVRLRNDDIEYLFKQVPVGTRVQFVNQPIKASVEPDGRRYLEVHQPLSRNQEEFDSSLPAPLPMSTAVTRFHRPRGQRLLTGQAGPGAAQRHAHRHQPLSPGPDCEPWPLPGLFVSSGRGVGEILVG